MSYFILYIALTLLQILRFSFSKNPMDHKVEHISILFPNVIKSVGEDYFSGFILDSRSV